MKDPPGSSPWERYLAVDLHKHYLVIGGVNATKTWYSSPVGWS